jgi:1-phosphofructokinase family hexose kinase
MILVVSPNLAVDATLEVDALRPGEVHRARRVARQAGGKGVNLARALRSLGPLGLPEDPPLVLGYAGGRSGETIREGLTSEGIAFELVPFPGESRSCTIILDAMGRATVVNEPGTAIEDASALLSKFDTLLSRSRAVAFMGSLPPRLPSDLYATLISRCREKRLLSLLDTSGDALKHGLAAGPSFAKPNRTEAEELLGRVLDNEEERRRAVETLRHLGAETAVITLGAAGFLLASSEGMLRCASDPARSSSEIRLGNPTGAGDALAAGLLAGAARGYPFAELARLAAAAAAASLAEGYGRFRPKDVRVEAFRVEKLIQEW